MTSATRLGGLAEERAAGLRLHAGGSGQAVVLLHGLGGSAANWGAVAAGLAGSFRVVAPDLPGHGGSPAPPAGAGIGSFADAVAAALAATDVERALVAGHSFGGQVALRLATRHPHLVAGLLLVSPSGIRTRARPVRLTVAATTLLRPGRLVAPFRHRWSSRAWFRRAVFRPWLVADAVSLSAEAASAFLDGPLEHADTRVAGRAMVDDDPRRELDRVRCPALVLWGARDPQLPVDDAFEYARRLRAPVRAIADCGHLAIGERPDAVLDGIRDLDVLVREAEALGEPRA
jgi:pimeloyl-ACP methyl ester carboxylesterase